MKQWVFLFLVCIVPFWVLAAEGEKSKEPAVVEATSDVKATEAEVTRGVEVPQPKKASMPAVQAMVSMRIENVHTVAEYAKLSEYLSQLPSVAKVDLSAVTEDTVEFQMSLIDSVESLQHALANSQELAEQPAVSTASTTMLSYHYHT